VRRRLRQDAPLDALRGGRADYCTRTDRGSSGFSVVVDKPYSHG
jgi:hypothetical protein